MITCHIENFEERLPELKVLLPGHYRELALNQDQVPLMPDLHHRYLLPAPRQA